MKSEVENYADFRTIKYSQCWEDADILLEALKVKEGGKYVSIASAGDNSFAILSKNPGKVIALDLNEQQLFCVELRKEAYRKLDYDEFMILAGFKEGDRTLIYQKIKDGLSEKCRGFWEKNADYIEEGYYKVGKLDRYFAEFSKKILSHAFSKEQIEAFFEKRPMEEQRKFYYENWNTEEWKRAVNSSFSEDAMAGRGRDKAFFRYVESSLSDHILKQLEEGFLRIPMYSNPYIHFFLLGNYSDIALPYALRKENFQKIKKNIDRLEIKKTSLEEYLEKIEEHSIDGFNLSDIFEYMSEDSMKSFYRIIVRAARMEARIVYWNMLVKRQCPSEFNNQVETDWQESNRLLNKDKAFFYERFLVEVVKHV